MYLGSVKFFKHLILAAVILLIALPTFFALRFRGELRAREAETAQLTGELEKAREQLKAGDTSARQPSETGGDTSEDPSADVPSADVSSPDVPSYQELYPDLYAPEPYHAVQRTSKVIYLTFDGRPSDNTDRILEALAAQNVKATFFVTGLAEDDEAGYQRLREISGQGHTLGMYSYSGDYEKIYQSVEAFLDDMYLIFTQIQSATGMTPTVFRFPGGSVNGYNAGFYQELEAEMIRRGFVPCDWNMSAQDNTPQPLSSKQIVQNVLQNADRIERGFVLMHDSPARTTTVNALATIITSLRDKGFQFDCLTPEVKPVLFGYRDY